MTHENFSCVCSVCEHATTTLRKLLCHVRHEHGLDSKQYYDQYLLVAGENVCIICGCSTKFVDFQYRQTCGSSCAAKKRRETLKADPEKFQAFTTRVAANQTRIWDDRDATGEKNRIAQSISETLKSTVDNMSAEERREKFGWLNKVDSETRQDVIERLTDPLKKFWNNASDTELTTLYERRRQSMYENGHAVAVTDYSKFTEYRRSVRLITERTYRQSKSEINPLGLKRSHSEYQLDHKYSIYDGFVNEVPPEVMGSKYNLELIPANANRKKRTQSSITIEELTELWQEATVKEHLSAKIRKST